MAIVSGSIGAQAAIAGARERAGVQLPIGGDAGGSFADTLAQALGEVSSLQDRAKDSIGAFLRGDPVEVHEVMAAAEEAGIALDALIQIRNKLTEAYRTVTQMQS